ncbi:DEAD/DEAH box helicase [Rubinisphaera italica]|uniref:ATP-dependent helicase HepA n=1 Tax=Rubinisphaera italica TaxID=2527969 RepID=A0A5C5XAI5_9PLAN|nr:DEAD/DEAH box helicase [Rubinisphaera italica]TWT59990.1 ATP-dependent helicase HepA [Rubinisphaera italica]
MNNTNEKSPLLLPAPRVDQIRKELKVQSLASGANGALKRWPQVGVNEQKLLTRPGFVPSWKPYWQKPQTLQIAFPDIIEFQQPKAEGKEREPLRSLKPPGAENEGDQKRPTKKPTRIKPPDDLLSMEDRLFYILQPPLENWLSGQELVMPFEPFSYQYEGIAWLFAQKSALLADEMGLGKTMQTITAVRLLLRSGQVRRVLMVCPKPLIPNWQREFKLWAEELPVTQMEGDGARRKMLWQMSSIPILLTNYEILARDLQNLEDEEMPKFDLVVLDESQRIKNRDSVTSQVIRRIPRRRSWSLTGTPIENRPEELASLFEFMGVVPPRSNPDLRQLKKLAEVYILRRTKDLVQPDMPPRLDRDALLDLSPAQQSAYQIAESDGVVQLNDLGDEITIQHVFELVMRLKQITNYDPLTGESCKLERLLADMEEIAASGAKAILFSQWTKTIDWLYERTKQFGTLVYHGGVPTKKREPILKQFKEDPNSHLLLMSYGTGAVGLNLQFSQYVFLYDRWWNPAIEDQAINRAHRIGVKNPVIVTRFICQNTIEQRIDLVLQQKREIFEKVLGEGDTSTTSLSMNAAEVFGLFDLKARASKGIKSIGPKAA